MALTNYSKKCTSCGGNRWKYFKDSKLWVCEYCGGHVERQEQYDGLYTIKNVVRQVILDAAYRNMDQADRNLSECMKINARYVGTLVASICARTLAAVSGLTLSGQDPRSLMGQIQRDYRTLVEESGSLGDDETELYEFMDSSDAWAALVTVFDTLGDQPRRDYLLTLLEPGQVFSQETNKSLIRFALNNGRIDLADQVIANTDNVDIPDAFGVVLSHCPDCPEKARMAGNLLSGGALKPGQEDVVEDYLSGSDSAATRSAVAAAALNAGLTPNLDLLLREVMSVAEGGDFQAILDGLFRRRLYDAEIDQLMGFAANQRDPGRGMAVLRAIAGSGQFVALNARQAQEFLFAAGAPVQQRLEILEILRKFSGADRMWEMVTGAYLCQGPDTPEDRDVMLDALCKDLTSVPAKDFEQYVLNVTADGKGKIQRIRKMLELSGMNVGFFRELAGKYLRGGKDDPQLKSEVLLQLMDSGLAIDGAVLVDYVCTSSESADSKVELVQMAVKNGTALRADALNIYLENCAANFEPKLFALLYRDSSKVSPKAMENYVLRCKDAPAVKAKNAAALARNTGMSLGSTGCTVRHLGSRISCSLAQGYLLTTGDDIHQATAMIASMTGAGTKLNTPITVDGVSKKINKYVLDNRSRLSPVTEQLCQENRLFSRFF